MPPSLMYRYPCSPGERSDTRDPACENPDVAPLIRATAPCCFAVCQSGSVKIFHFTEIRICRMCRPSRLILEGRSCGRHCREPGLRWTRQRRARESGQGGLLSVSPKLRADERRCQVRRASISAAKCTTPSNPVAPTNRAYGKTVWSWPSLLRSSSCGGGSRVNRRGAGGFRESEGGQNELGSRESTA